MGEMMNGNLVMKTHDGKEIKIENATITEISKEPTESYEINHIVSNIRNYNYNLSIKIENISRKRFIKLLMANGIARNGAKDIANYIHKKYGCYNQAYLL